MVILLAGATGLHPVACETLARCQTREQVLGQAERNEVCFDIDTVVNVCLNWQRSLSWKIIHKMGNVRLLTENQFYIIDNVKKGKVSELI